MPRIFHIVHYRMLESIVQHDGLWCDKERRRRVKNHINIGHQNIKERRERWPIPVAPGGVLADYVPFYFAPRSPMLFVIHRGGVEGFTDGQNPIVHLVAETDQVAQRGLTTVFTDRHAAVALARYSGDLRLLEERIDWQVMDARIWRNTVDDPDRKERRQAEFLVHRFLPWDLIREIGVRTRTVEAAVNSILHQTDNPPTVNLRPNWYYN